ncbi:MAG: HEAT repeat domain-containing protein [Acidobacteria bacterium]|nr:HEAT repeat domain-containing protein [Acidobacteriota bacterium]
MRPFLIQLLLGGCLFAQNPKVGIIEIFGARKVPQELIRKALGALEGDSLPPSKTQAESRIEDLDGIVRASLEAVCCDQGKAILYVGIEERGAPHFDFHTPPGGELKVPDEVEKEWTEFITSISVAVRRGNAEEDLLQGHSLMSDPDVRRSQQRFIELAAKHFDLLREILRKAADEQQRAIAAFVLGYSSRKKQVADDLQYAMQDSDSTVRNNAMRALNAILVFGQKNPDAGIRVSPTWFVEMLNSVHFTDRNKASISLVSITEKRDQSTLSYLRERALGSLTEMAGWRSLGHALPAFILLGRIAGLPEEQIQELWKQGNREELLKKVKESGRRK